MLIAIGAILSLLLSALFSGSEIAFVSGNKLRIELRRKKNTLRGRLFAHFYDRPADFLSSMLVGNNIALVIFASLLTVPLEPLLQTYMGIESEGWQLLTNTVIITLIVLVFGEFLPKTLFRLYSDTALYNLAVPLRTLELILLPFSWVMAKTSDALLQLFVKEPAEQLETTFTRVDLENFINETTTEEEESIDKELFGKALNLPDIRVRDCMVPRTDIEHLDVKSSIEDLERLFQETRLSRILITDNELDNVLGYVHHQQLLNLPDTIEEAILPITFIPEVMRVTDLMDKFIKERLSIVSVVDEFGGVSGVITLEDILEEIFGEIEDEYDEDEYIEQEISEGVYLFSGRLEIDHLNEKFQLELPEGEYHTLSGYLVTRATTIPEKGEVLEFDHYQFEITSVSNTRIETIRVTKIGEEEG